LGCRDFLKSLFDLRLVKRWRVQSILEGAIRLPQTKIDCAAFVFSFALNQAN
jgi:hypothetical protein